MYNSEFWKALDELMSDSEIIIDRPKGTANLNTPILSIELTMDI